MSQQDRKIINSFLVSCFRMLSSMYELAAEDAENARTEELRADWEEWMELDRKSQKFVIDYLNS